MRPLRYLNGRTPSPVPAEARQKSDYDDRPEYEKDVWDLQRMAIPVSLSLSNTTLNFRLIRQFWLRKAVKAYLRYCLAICAESTCRTRLQALTRFSEFLARKRPKATAKAITRRLLVEYLGYLPKRVGIAVRKNDVINVRTFLEIAARERWLPIGSERMIYDEEVPQPPKPQPRYIPSAVLDQLNRNLGKLKAPWMQMILILQAHQRTPATLIGLSDARRARHVLSPLHARQDEARTHDTRVSRDRARHTRTTANRAEQSRVINLIVPESKRKSVQAVDLRATH
jgi:hypothetical protein